MSDEHEVAELLKQLIKVSQKGYDDLKAELNSLRDEMKESNKEHSDRLNRLEQFMFTAQGGLVVTRTLAGASLLGALLAISVSMARAA